MGRKTLLSSFSLLFCFLLFVCLAGAQIDQTETFQEELLVRPLADGNVFSHLQFSSSIRFNPQNTSLNHFSLFPKPVAQTIQKFGAEQVQLTFTQGRWHENHWGAPLIDSPSGVQLIASFLPSKDSRGQWDGLIHALAGMFCASLDVLDESKSVDPRYTYSEFLRQNEKLEQENDRDQQFQWQKELLDDIEKVMNERGEAISDDIKKMKETPPAMQNFVLNHERIAKQQSEDSSSRLFYGEMPEEAVCTENLTPWTKLLPCRSESGLGKLLHSLSLYDTLYHSMGVTVRYSLPNHCSSVENCDDVTLELIQSLGIVFRTEEMEEYQIAKLYGEHNLSNCVLTKGNSFVYVQLPSDSETSVFPAPTSEQFADSPFQVYELQSGSPLALKIRQSTSENILKEKRQSMVRSPVVVSRSSLGNGEENGGILMQISNPSSEAVSLVYLEYLPWYFPIYFHSFRVFFNGEQIGLSDIATKWNFVPAEDHGVPSVIEVEFVLPAMTTAIFTYRHDQTFMQWTEHPPDAHRGSDIASACVTVKYDSKPEQLRVAGIDWSPKKNQTEIMSSPFEYRLYTEGLLVLLPTPDFSMPYNVITLTCTMFAIIFTTTINVLTRRFSYLTEGGEYSSGRLSMFLYRKIRDFFTK